MDYREINLLNLNVGVSCCDIVRIAVLLPFDKVSDYVCDNLLTNFYVGNFLMASSE